jgi:uncharacterized protein YoxC
MDTQSFIRQFRWHIVIIGIALLIVFVLSFFTDIFEKTENLRPFLFLLGSVVFLIALLVMLSKVCKMLDAVRDNSAKLEEVAGALEKIGDWLSQINQSTRISEAAKAIVSREADMQSLREAVFERLQQQDFDAAGEIIDEIAKRPAYQKLSKELKDQAEKYRFANVQERINQSIAHIEGLLDSYQWGRASLQIEGLIRAYPESEEAKAMRQKLIDKKQLRKKELLATWDNAIQRKETDLSLEILKELDHYLTPNEALALQEAAKDVFRSKLHNLGVQFSIAVTEKRWNNALDIGQQITNDFPNSRMAEEIRAKLDVLRQNVQMQSSEMS